MAEADAVLERQAARPDVTSAMLTSVLTKRGGKASAEVVARTRAKRDSLKAIERDARKPPKAKPEEPNAAETINTIGPAGWWLRLSYLQYYTLPNPSQPLSPLVGACKKCLRTPIFMIPFFPTIYT